MGERFRITVPFGGGMDRSQGKVATRRATVKDIRNVYPYEDKFVVRRGMAPAAEFRDDANNRVSHIIGGNPLRTSRIGIVVGYQITTGRVHVWKVDRFGENPALILRDTTNEPYWFEVAPDDPYPQVFTADSYGKVFLAHDEPDVVERAQTFYFDVATNTLKGLTADLDRDATPEPVRFRGVERHLAYLLGWGFGTGTDPQRPEVVRASMPQDPTTFKPEHLWYAGQRGDPVQQVISNGNVADVRKEVEAHRIFGYDRSTFGIAQYDSHSGQAGPHLGVQVNGQVFSWSAEGPVVTDVSNPAEPIHMPLDLEGFQPADLVTPLEMKRGFAFYVHRRRTVVFAFGQRGYALSLRNPNAWKWSYMEFGKEIYCGFHIYRG